MNMRYLYFVFLICFGIASGLAEAGENSSKARIVTVGKATTSDEKVVLDTVQKIYKFSSRDFVCVWDGKNVKGDFVKKFSPYFSDQIINKFFRDNKACEVVGGARYGFEVLDDTDMPLNHPDYWSDKKYKLVRIETPEITNDKATVGVRFWTYLEPGKDPIDQDHGGTIVYLIRIGGVWKVSNLDSYYLSGFRSLIDSYPSVANPEWDGTYNRKSLKGPQHFK